MLRELPSLELSYIGVIDILSTRPCTSNFYRSLSRGIHGQEDDEHHECICTGAPAAGRWQQAGRLQRMAAGC
jgi:hypothetical protein